MVIKKDAPIIINWEVVESHTHHLHVRGNVYRHEIYEDGIPILTSRIEGCYQCPYPAGVGFWVETRNTVYQLEVEYGNGEHLRNMELIIKQLSHEHSHEHEQEED